MVGVIMLSGRAHTRAFRVGQVCQVRAGLTGDNPIILEMIIVTITINITNNIIVIIIRARICTIRRTKVHRGGAAYD